MLICNYKKLCSNLSFIIVEVVTIKVVTSRLSFEFFTHFYLSQFECWQLELYQLELSNLSCNNLSCHKWSCHNWSLVPNWVLSQLELWQFVFLKGFGSTLLFCERQNLVTKFFGPSSYVWSKRILVIKKNVNKFVLLIQFFLVNKSIFLNTYFCKTKICFVKICVWSKYFFGQLVCWPKTFDCKKTFFGQQVFLVEKKWSKGF